MPHPFGESLYLCDRTQIDCLRAPYRTRCERCRRAPVQTQQLSGRGSGNRTRLSAQERFKPINCALRQSPRSLHAAVHMLLPPIGDNLPHVCRACTPL